jgi:hypothetical protein
LYAGHLIEFHHRHHPKIGPSSNNPWREGSAERRLSSLVADLAASVQASVSRRLAAASMLFAADEA